MAKFSKQQPKEVSKLEEWYAEQISELKQREQRIIQEYERKKADMLKQQIDDARL
jgi:pantothenate kinase